MGQQYNLGYADSTLANENTDGAVFLLAGTTKDFYYSAPLIGLLGNFDKLIPLFVLNNIRLALTLDSAANVTSNITGDNKITKFVISIFEVCYNYIDM